MDAHRDARRPRADSTRRSSWDSKVLLAAGYTGNVPLATAELFDPATGTFALTGSLATARWGHTATLLPDGRVFVVGGTNVGAFTPGVSLATAELYQPSTGTWTYGGAMLTARDSHSSTLLQNGTVLIAGGVNGSTGLTSAQLFDPATETWSLTGSLPLADVGPLPPFFRPETVLLPAAADPRVSSPRCITRRAPRSRPGPPLAYGRDDHAGAMLDDGSLLLIGGYGTLAAGRTAADSAEMRTGAIVLTGLSVTPCDDHAPLVAVTFQRDRHLQRRQRRRRDVALDVDRNTESVATVSGPGKIHTEGPGTAIIRATFAGFVFDATLTVPRRGQLGVVGLLQGGDVQLRHLQHRLQHASGARGVATAAQQPAQRRRNDLPRHARTCP